MKIVIAGAGEVGTHLAKLLSNENQDIIVIDNTESKLRDLDNYNLLTYKGNPAAFKVQKKAGVGQADLFVGLTPNEASNVIACAIAKSLGAKKTVARIDNYDYKRKENRAFFDNLGISELIYPEKLAAEEVRMALHHPWVRNWFSLFNGELIVVGVKLRENAKIVGMHLRDFIEMSTIMHISAIRRNNEIIIPTGNDQILPNDIAYIVTTKEHLIKVVEACGKSYQEVKRIMVMGGSRIIEQLAILTDDEYKFTIIENDDERCQHLAEHLPGCKIIKGDGRNNELLREEGLEGYDAFIALTQSSEINILSCLTAKGFGVKKTIAEVEDIQLISEAEALNIGTVINKKLLASSRIFQTLLDNDDTNAKCLALADAEVAELVVKEKSSMTKGAVKDLKLIKGMTIAGLIRGGKGYLVNGLTEFKAGDHVVVFCMSGLLHKVEKLFKD